MAGVWEPAKDVKLLNGKPVIGSYLGRIIEALSERMIPTGGEMTIALGETGAYEYFARYLRDQPAGGRFGIKLVLFLFDLAPFLFIGRFARFVNLSPQEQELYLMDWYASRIYYRRMIVVLLKTLAGVGYYNDPKVLNAIGYHLKCEERGGR